MYNHQMVHAMTGSRDALDSFEDNPESSTDQKAFSLTSTDVSCLLHMTSQVFYLREGMYNISETLLVPI